MNLSQRYETAVQQGSIQYDSKQREILDHMQGIIAGARQGLYLYGPVGTGKTYLTNLLYDALPTAKKKRFHAHQFMQYIDAQLRMRQGDTNPLHHIAQTIAATTRFIFLDEFLVQDIGHAMILAELLRALLAEGLILITTSNIHPDQLYAGGLNRQRFLAAIDLIKNHCSILHLNSDNDHRTPSQAPQYHISRSDLAHHFNHAHSGDLILQQRTVPYIKAYQDAIWFDFNVLCQIPRCTLDYLELSSRYKHICLSDIPPLTEAHRSQTVLLMHLVDVLYDQKIRLTLATDIPLEQLCPDPALQPTFTRTLSRLIQMHATPVFG